MVEEKNKLKIIKNIEKQTVNIQFFSKKNTGITLIALVITIIILLILAGVSISTVVGENGVITKASNAVIENRGGSVQEARDFWHSELEVDEKLGTTEGRTLDEILGELETDGLLTEDEVKEVNKTGQVTIGSRIIVFKELTLAEKVENKVIKIGDYVSYTPDTATWDWSETVNGVTYATYSGSTSNTGKLTTESLNWRVLDVKDGQVKLISDAPTSSTITLKGYQGYNNAVYLLDKLCSTLYSSSKGTVQNLKIEDIQGHMDLNYWDYHDDANSNVDTGKYGGIAECTTWKKYPNIFAEEKTGTVDGITGIKYDLSEQTELINQTVVNTAKTSITLKQTVWSKNMTTLNFEDSIYYTLFINNGSNYSAYWLSSRCIQARYTTQTGGKSGTSVDYNISAINNKYVSSSNLYNSSDSTWSNSYRVRPVITLKSEVQIDIRVAGDGTLSNPWVLKEERE